MKRVVCIHWPNWPIQRRCAGRSKADRSPLVIFADAGSRGAQVVACCLRAARAGVTPAMPLAEARTLAGPGASLEPDRPGADRQALVRLAETTWHFTPLVGIEAGERPEGILGNVTGCGHLFGGDRGLARGLVETYQRDGYRVHAAVAGTLGAAWAAARGAAVDADRPAVTVIPEGRERERLESLSVEWLRLPATVVRDLAELDIRHIGQLWTLPRSTLTSRFGPELLVRIEQALGERPEPLEYLPWPHPVRAEVTLEFPLADREAVSGLLSELVGEVAGELGRRREGTGRLVCRASGIGGEETLFEVGLVEPTGEREHLWDLVAMKLESHPLPEAVTGLVVEAECTGPLGERQATLFELDESRPSVDRLVNRLSTRLGPQAVLRPSASGEVQPEHGGGCRPLVGGECIASDRLNDDHADRTAKPVGQRPLRLVASPRAIPVTSVVPEGPPARFRWEGRDQVVARSWGPERIDTGWWRDRPARRDYYRVETSSGQQFWLFRHRESGAWFLHGVFE